MITDNYIKMCNKAKEIQKYILKQSEEYQDECKWVTIDKTNEVVKYYIWLPTQEQLQEILQKGREWVYYGSYPLSQFSGWILTSGGANKFYYHQYKNKFKSITELWLAFVMHEKYQKSWDGENWQKS
jgi:hypothetical protein